MAGTVQSPRSGEAPVLPQDVSEAIQAFAEAHRSAAEIPEAASTGEHRAGLVACDEAYCVLVERIRSALANTLRPFAATGAVLSSPLRELERAGEGVQPPARTVMFVGGEIPGTCEGCALPEAACACDDEPGDAVGGDALHNAKLRAFATRIDASGDHLTASARVLLGAVVWTIRWRRLYPRGVVSDWREVEAPELSGALTLAEEWEDENDRREPQHAAAAATLTHPTPEVNRP
jgi:hypothetical protein